MFQARTLIKRSRSRGAGISISRFANTSNRRQIVDNRRRVWIDKTLIFSPSCRTSYARHCSTFSKLTGYRIHFNCGLMSGAGGSVTSGERSYFPHHFTEKNKRETRVKQESPDNKKLIDVASNSPSASWQRSSVKLFFARNTSETKDATNWSMSGLIKNQILSVVFNLLHEPSVGLAGLDLIDGFPGTCLSADWHIGAVKGEKTHSVGRFTMDANPFIYVSNI